MLLTKICIISAIIGIILLVIISDKLEAPTYNIGSIKKEDINKPIKIIGTVKSATIRTSVATAEIEDNTGSINVVLFKPEKVKISKGSTLMISGKISLFEDKPQIYAETVKVVN